VGVAYLVVLACVFRGTSIKKVVNFFPENSAPQRKFWLRLFLNTVFSENSNTVSIRVVKIFSALFPSKC